MIRRLEVSNAPANRDLMIQASETDAFISTPEERASMPLSFWEKRVAHPDGLSVTFGAFDGESMVGSATVEFLTREKVRHKSRLLGMFVLSAYRSRGLGQQLVEAVIEEARSRPQARMMSLTVTEGNDAAISLYERCGFQIIGTEPKAIATPRGDLGMVHMWLDLETARGDEGSEA